jgi:alpha-tubulin suppressor-like RCC1 family protein
VPGRSLAGDAGSRHRLVELPHKRGRVTNAAPSAGEREHVVSGRLALLGPKLSQQRDRFCVEVDLPKRLRATLPPFACATGRHAPSKGTKVPMPYSRSLREKDAHDRGVEGSFDGEGLQRSGFGSHPSRLPSGCVPFVLGVLGASAAIACSPSDSRPATGPLPPGLASSASARATAIAAGYGHSCALTSSGAVKCWGRNSSGQLGNGTTTDRYVPVAVSGLAGGVQAIAGGTYHTCALTSAGGVKCWGRNSSGQLGDGTTTKRYVPVAVSGLAGGVQAIAAGTYHTCALTSAGGVKCWGRNSSGQLGDGTTTDRHAPVDVPALASGVTAIAVGYFHTCELTSAGAVKCWGYNRSGQLGDGTTTDRNAPVDVPGLASGVTAITAGGGHSCALTSAGGVKCWGSNYFGELGDGTTTRRLIPAAVSGLAGSVAAIAAGGEAHGCALTSAGAVKCWGYNGYGQLGDGTTTDRHVPVGVSGLVAGVQTIAAGGYGHTCALTSAGAVRCWGRNSSGQLGDGTTIERHTPMRVISFGGVDGRLAPPRCVDRFGWDWLASPGRSKPRHR